MNGKLLMIGTDRLLFDKASNVAKRQIEYARNWQEVHIIIFTSNKFSEINLSDNVWVYPTRSWNKLLYVLDAIKLGGFIIRGRGITNITCQDPSLTAISGSYLKRMFRLPLEIQIHGDIGSPYYVKSFKNRILKMMAISNIPKADHVRVVSERIKSYIMERLDIREDKIEVRPIAVDTQYIKSLPVNIELDLHKKYPQFNKIVLIASRLEKEKNIDLAIHSFRKVVDNNEKAGLIIVGSGREYNNLKYLAGKLNLNKNVQFESWANKDTLISYYKTCDLFLNTSDYEGYGMTLIEARAANAKIISTDVGIAREVGATICERDENDISRLILELFRYNR